MHALLAFPVTRTHTASCYTRFISNQHQLINSQARPFKYKVLPYAKIVALLCLLSCLFFVFSFSFFLYICSFSFFMTTYLGHYICHLMNKTGLSVMLREEIMFCWTCQACRFESRDSLKVTLCASSMSLHWCFSKIYLDYLKTDLPDRKSVV